MSEVEDVKPNININICRDIDIDIKPSNSNDIGENTPNITGNISPSHENNNSLNQENHSDLSLNLNLATQNDSINESNSSVQPNSLTAVVVFPQDVCPPEPCLICGDVASGKHYGLRSCEACKAFFKRTVQGKIEYSCPATKECEINKRRRKACQACRFQKCLRMGMLKEGVRLDRVRGGRQKYRRGQSPTSSMSNGNIANGGQNGNWNDAVASSSSSSTSYYNQGQSQASLFASPYQHFSTPPTTNCHSTSSSFLHLSAGASPSLLSLETNRVITALIHCEPDELAALTPHVVSNLPSSLSAQLKTLYILSDLFDRELVSLIGWAKQIPGFSETISLNDQMRLLQSTWAEIIALSIAYRSHLKRLELSSSSNSSTPTPTGSSPTLSMFTSASSSTSIGGNNNYNSEIRLVFARDFIMDYKHALACGAEQIFFNCVQLIKRLDQLKITPKEYMILKALSLTNADVRLENIKTAHNLRDTVIETLYETVQSLLVPDLLTFAQNQSQKSTTTHDHSTGGRPNSPNLNQLLTPGSPSSASRTPPASLVSSTPIFTVNNPTASSSSTSGHFEHQNNNLISTLNSSISLKQSMAINLRLNQILLCLPILRQIDTSLRKFWNEIRKGSLNIPMNKLFEEMLEPCQRVYKSTAEM